MSSERSRNPRKICEAAQGSIESFGAFGNGIRLEPFDHLVSTGDPESLILGQAERLAVPPCGIFDPVLKLGRIFPWAVFNCAHQPLGT